MSFWGPFAVSMAMMVSYALVFGSLERVWPARRGQARLRRGLWVDLAYVVSFSGIAWALDQLPLAEGVERLGGTVVGPALAASHDFFAGLPRPVEALLAVGIADLAGYWKHRLHHTRWLWPFHAIHHSSREVDWLSNERIHPVEGVLTALFQWVPLLLLGVSGQSIAVAAIVRRVHSLYQHGNLRFSYGWGDRVFVSPSLHRWHHSPDPAMVDRNYANVFALYDWMFGTLTLPPTPEPPEVGLAEVPEDFWAQLVWPFTSRPSLRAGGRRSG